VWSGLLVYRSIDKDDLYEREVDFRWKGFLGSTARGYFGPTSLSQLSHRQILALSTASGTGHYRLPRITCRITHPSSPSVSFSIMASKTDLLAVK